MEKNYNYFGQKLPNFQVRQNQAKFGPPEVKSSAFKAFPTENLIFDVRFA